MSRARVPLAVAASTEALKDSGLDPENMSLDEKREIGVVLGTGGGAHDFSDAQYHMYYAGKVKQISIFSIPSGTMGTMSSEVSMRFGFRGLSHVVTSGCTSSTDAIAYATRQLQLGTLPMMLVGGVDSPLAWGILKGFMFMRIMTESWNHAPERGSRPFNLDRDGFVLAEGSWMFVLEEYEHARARGAHIYAEIAGYGSTCEAFHRVRLQECGEEPARAIGLAMKEAGIAADNVQYVNLHGTSTDLNDRIETARAQAGTGRSCIQSSHVCAQVTDWTSAGRLRRRGYRRDAYRHAAQPASTHHQPGKARSRLRSGLRARSRPHSADRARCVQLHCFWIKELCAGAAESQLTALSKNAGWLYGVEQAFMPAFKAVKMAGFSR